jgi:NADH-quinone oxidoreductase subunit J
VLEMAGVLMGGFQSLDGGKAISASALEAGATVVAQSNTKMLGKLLYTQYLYPLEVAAAILLVAVIAAIALTLRERKDTKNTNPAEQVRVRAKDRLQIIKLAATTAAVPEVVTAPAAEEKKV